MRAIIPISQMQRRMPEGGRIRIGKKTGGGKGRPTSIDTFRFTSEDREAIDQISTLYGGNVEPWSDGHGPQWQVETGSNQITIVLPPDPLGGTPIYELWSGGGCQRRCDGETTQVPISGGDIGEMQDAPCICSAKGEMECKVKVRLNVILPDVKFAGTWRLETSSWNAAQELPGMVEMVQSMQERGLTRGLLALEKRQSKDKGKTYNFVVPTIRMSDSLDGLAAGAAGVAQLAGPQSAPILGTGKSEGQVQAEGLPAAAEASDVAAAAHLAPEVPPSSVRTEEVADLTSVTSSDTPGVTPKRKALTRSAHAAIKKHGWDYETQVKPALLSVYELTMSGLSDDQLVRWLEMVDEEGPRSRFEEHMPFVIEPEDTP